MSKFKFTGRETPRELRQALSNCGELMTQMLLGLTKDRDKIEQILLIRTLEIDILGQMSRNDLPMKEGEVWN